MITLKDLIEAYDAENHLLFKTSDDILEIRYDTTEDEYFYFIDEEKLTFWDSDENTSFMTSKDILDTLVYEVNQWYQTVKPLEPLSMMDFSSLFDDPSFMSAKTLHLLVLKLNALKTLFK